ncbi:MAG: hypothetical protein ACRENP_09420 [Longimicrobiales bacterium]
MVGVRGNYHRTGVAQGLACAVLFTAFTDSAGAHGQQINRLRDRGAGVPTSMFGTYIERGQLLVYPFFEYYRDSNGEYSPDEFGFGLDQDFRGKYSAAEGLIFLSYGFTHRLAVEFEAAIITARQEKSSSDPTSMPAHVEESGIGDVEGQVRWRWNQESDRRPEFFSYFETVFPLQKQKRLIGTQAWEFKLGTGVVRGFAWGTATLRAALEYDGDQGSVGLGEYALEYLKRVSRRFRLFAGVEGSGADLELITEAQWFLTPNLFLKFNNAIGLTSKATDWAPEIGIMLSFR